MKIIKHLLLLNCCLFLAMLAMADPIVVKNITELKKANSEAKPGDVIVLENGEWKDVTIALSCSGTKEQPITFKARTPGKVLITGHSQLKIGGNYVVVDGLYFTNGYAGKDAVIDFKINKNQLANHCRVTNCAIKSFNNPRRLDENYWVSFSGRNNRLDHCSFVDKKNLGVLLAVTLEDDRSRENFHSIDHNYFGYRIPLASNGGEIIRVGVSQHCEFNSNTKITDNFFEKCDGETEIVSIKSGGNIISNNLFKECQGSVVLRHGDNNTVENNIFLGNYKEGTGGVRVINRGQWVVNNLFYQCRGVDFRSPLAIMNGVPNSPAHRYVQVTDAVIANNTFFQCAPVTFCEGSDKERSTPPANVFLVNNIFYNDKDSIIYKVYDDIRGFNFKGNKISKALKQAAGKGFERTVFSTQKMDAIAIPGVRANISGALPDSLQRAAQKRLTHTLSLKPGFTGLPLVADIHKTAYTATGAHWLKEANGATAATQVTADCSTAEDVYRELERKESVVIRLTGTTYTLNKPISIAGKVTFSSDHKTPITINTEKIISAFVIKGNGHLKLENLDINGSGVQATHFISSDTSRSSDHYNVIINKCSFKNFNSNNGCTALFYGFKSMVADSIIIRNSHFSGNSAAHLVMNEEKDDKGYYNAERIVLDNNNFTGEKGILLNIYRGGNDESTMGPQLFVTGNIFSNCNGETDDPFIELTGVQKTRFINNTFVDCHAGKPLFTFKDIVRADHVLKKNSFTRSGTIQTNAFVRELANALY